MSEPNDQANETEQPEVEQPKASDDSGVNEAPAAQGDGDPAPAGE